MPEHDETAFSAWTVTALAATLLTVGFSAIAASQAGPVAEERSTTWLEAPLNPVNDPSDGKAERPSVVVDDGIYRMWFTGSSGGSSGLEMATSPDGLTWSTPEDASDGLDWLNLNAHVERIGENYRVWYWDGWVYETTAIRTATSTDGVTWEDDQPIQQVEGDVFTGEFSGEWNSGVRGLGEVVYNPAGADEIVDPEDPESVLENRYIGFFATTNGGQQFVGLAVSADGVTWEAYRDGAAPILEPSEDGWDATHLYPGTVAVSDGFHMWYSGGQGSAEDGVGYAHSTNLVDWEPAEDQIFHVEDGESWRSEATYAPAVLPVTGQMWFTGEGASGEPAVGYAQGVPLSGVG